MLITKLEFSKHPKDSMCPIIPVWGGVHLEAQRIKSRVVLVVTLLCGFKWP